MTYVKNGLIVIGLFVLSQLGMTAYSVAKMSQLENGQKLLSAPMTYGLLVFVVLNILFMVWLAKKLKLCQFTFDWVTKKNLLLVVAAFAIGRVIAVGGTLLLQMTSEQQTTANDALVTNLFYGENPLLIFLLIAVAAPIMEEIVFRGGIIGLLFKKQPYLGIAASAIIFGFVHTATSPIEFLIYGSLGALMSFAYVKTQRLEVAISVHFLNNVLAAVALSFLG